MKVDLLGFLVVAAATTPMVITTVWATAATFGLLQDHCVPGTGDWIPITQKSSDLNISLRESGFLCVV
jgi:hypothetical protein